MIIVAEAWWQAGRHGAEENAESSTLRLAGSRQRLSQGHTYSSETTPPNSATPYGPMGAISIQTNAFHSLAPVGL